MIFEHAFGNEILQGLGNAALLNQRLIAFFSSRQCTGAAISAAIDWAVLARPLTSAKLPNTWHQALSEGLMTVVSPARTKNRLTQQLAAQRNNLVAQLAKDIVIAHVSEDGSLFKQAMQWRVHYLTPQIMKI
jgi:hypothetical protein